MFSLLLPSTIDLLIPICFTSPLQHGHHPRAFAQALREAPVDNDLDDADKMHLLVKVLQMITALYSGQISDDEVGARTHARTHTCTQRYPYSARRREDARLPVCGECTEVPSIKMLK